MTKNNKLMGLTCCLDISYNANVVGVIICAYFNLICCSYVTRLLNNWEATEFLSL